LLVDGTAGNRMLQQAKRSPPSAPRTHGLAQHGDSVGILCFFSGCVLSVCYALIYWLKKLMLG